MSIELTTKLTDMALAKIDERESPDVADCDCCGVVPGTHKVMFAGLETWICDECSDITPRRRPRFHTREDHEAYEAGVRAQGEI